MNNILTIKVFFGNIERGCAFDKKLSISAKDTELTMWPDCSRRRYGVNTAPVQPLKEREFYD